LQTSMWLSSSKKYAMDRFLEERASCVSVHHVCGNGILGAKVRLSTNIAIVLTLNCIWARLGTDRQDVAQLLLRSGFVGR
jgi:hypothetical protein